MSRKRETFSGIERLVALYKSQFRIWENLNHYSSEDYITAEREYVRYCLKNGPRTAGRPGDALM